MEGKNTYIIILIEVLQKKVLLLEQLTSLTIMQKDQIEKETIESEEFENIIRQKDELLIELDKADDGFEIIFDKVKQELSEHGSQYPEEIEKLQKLIQKITDKSVKLQGMEQRNSRNMEQVLNKKKTEIKEFHVNHRTVSSYYKNMANQYDGKSFFMDRKK